MFTLALCICFAAASCLEAVPIRTDLQQLNDSLEDLEKSYDDDLVRSGDTCPREVNSRLTEIWNLLKEYGRFEPDLTGDYYNTDHWPEYRYWSAFQDMANCAYQRGGEGKCNMEEVNKFGGSILRQSEEVGSGTDGVPFRVFKLSSPMSLGKDIDIDCVVAFKGTSSVRDLYTDLKEVSDSKRSIFKSSRIERGLAEFMETNWARGQCRRIVATGHSLGGATALNAALYLGIRAFTFAAPGPSRGGDNHFHENAEEAMKSSATAYISPDHIPFATGHIGDRMCDLSGIEGKLDWPRLSFFENALGKMNSKLAAHKDIMSHPLKELDDGDCFYKHGEANDNAEDWSRSATCGFEWPRNNYK